MKGQPLGPAAMPQKIKRRIIDRGQSKVEVVFWRAIPPWQGLPKIRPSSAAIVQ
jgi:hypothetical protein